ncbi:MAG: hypothetical protein LBB62_08325 [Proteiniphilum sp.]|jgi:hypothetical protein|nr:hypothetical protein [Proteiniphilum sp.]
MDLFKVTAARNIGGKRETEKFEDGVLTKRVAGKVKRIENTQLHRNTDGSFVRMIGGKVQDKAFEVLESFTNDIGGSKVSVVVIRFPNSKLIEIGESVQISAETFPSVARIAEAFHEQLGKEVKGCFSTDLFTIKKV